MRRKWNRIWLSLCCGPGLLALILYQPLLAQDVPGPDNDPGSFETDTVLEKIETLSRLSRSVQSATGYSDIVEQCDQILATEPENSGHVKYLKSLKAWALNRRAKSRMELSERFIKIGNRTQADQILEKARRDLDAAIEADETKWQAPCNRATLLTQMKDYSGAIADWTRLVGMRPGTAEALIAVFNRAELYYESRRFDEALTDYQDVVDADTRDLQALNGCGNCLLALDRAEEAIGFYDRILEQDHNNAGALVNRGDAWQQLQHWENALNDYRASLASEVSGRTLQRTGWLLATCPDESISDAATALSSIQEAIARDGESPEYLDTLAAALAATGQFDQARDTQTRVIALTDTDSGDNPYRVRQVLYENEEPFRQSGQVGDENTGNQK